MCSLDQFPPLPDGESIPLCETDGRIQYSLPDLTDASVFTNSLSFHPKIEISRDMLHPGAHQISNNQIFLPVSETLWEKLQNAWYENGFIEVLRVATCEQERQNGFSFTYFCAKQILTATKIFSKLSSRIPFFTSTHSAGDVIPVCTDWVRCIDWHPHCCKVAVVTRDDAVRVYSSLSKLIPILKCKSQRNVSCVSWRPYSASDIAVGCEVGVYVWVIDPNSVVMRPSASSAILLKKPYHTNVASISWSPEGDLLVSASRTDNTMYVWEVSTERAVPLKFVVGGGISLVSYAPNSSKVFAATNNIVFRVWDTSFWEPESWSLQSGHVTSACWSACSSVLLFSSSTEPVIYAMTFGPMATVFNAKTPKSVVAVIDITAITVPSGERVGGEVSRMVWDQKSHYLVISFIQSPLIAVFVTNISSTVHIAPCCFIKGYTDEIPIEISFQKNFEDGANLTIAWSSQRVQYFPFIFKTLESASTYSPRYPNTDSFL